MRFGTVVCAVWICLVACGEASAGGAPPAETASPPDESSIDWTFAPRISVAAGIGYMTDSAREMVYDTPSGDRVSQLNWKIQNALVLRGTATLHVTDWLSASLGGWTKIDSNNLMDDYDWLVPPYTQWSDHSHHTDTQLNKANQGDLSLAARLYNEDGWALSATAGYQWTGFKWSAYGGHYVYSIFGFRDAVGDFTPGELGITYSQTFKAPYIGVSGTYNLDDDWQFSAALRGSPWVLAASDIDHHVLRDLIFHDKSNKSRMIAVSAGAAYNIDARAQIGATVEYQAYTLGKGSTRMLDQTTGIVSVFSGDASGIGNSTLTAMLNIVYRFDP
jgi:plasminogen activator